MSRYSDLVTQAAREMVSFPPTPSNPAQDGSPLIKLDSNENPFGPSPLALDAIRKAASRAHEYPDDNCLELREKLAELHQVRVDQVSVTAGSTGMLSLLCQTLLAPGLNAVTSACSFIVYAMLVRASGARLIETPLHEDGFDLDAILQAINPETRLVFLANPNNPTGTMLEAREVEKFLAAVPDHVVVVIDEAYYEFAEHFAARRRVEYSRSLQYVRQGAPVVVLRTFSKVHGLAGLRIGYGLGPAELLGYCARMANTYSVPSVAQGAALAALDDQSHIEKTVLNNAEQAEVLARGLAKLGYRVVPSAANSVYFDVGEDASILARRLRAEGVSVRALNGWGAPQCIRASIGTPEHNQMFLDAVRRVSSLGRKVSV